MPAALSPRKSIPIYILDRVDPHDPRYLRTRRQSYSLNVKVPKDIKLPSGTVIKKGEQGSVEAEVSVRVGAVIRGKYGPRHCKTSMSYK